MKYIMIPLHQHPHNRHPRHPQRPNTNFLAKQHALGRKVRRGDHVRRQREAVEASVADFAHGAHANDAGKEGPGSESAPRSCLGSIIIVTKRGGGLVGFGTLEEG